MLSHVVAHQARAVLHLQAAHQAAVRLAIQVARLAAARLTLHLSSVARQAVRTALALCHHSSAALQAA